MGEFTSDGPDARTAESLNGELSARAAAAREMAEEVRERAQKILVDARDLVLRYPAWAIAGAAAAGFLFARFVARRR
jgi:ElaB/YqjD/DUF883 family membrane-anchored ribosome-binding protein